VILRLDIASARSTNEVLSIQVTPVTPAEVLPTYVTPVTSVTADALESLHDITGQDMNVLDEMSNDYPQRHVQKLASAKQV
jgi:hypothetical protein